MSLHPISSPDREWQVWTPTYTGFSADPTGSERRFAVIGKTCIVLHQTAAGTSNGTGFTLTLPIPSLLGGCYQFARITNNSVVSATYGMVETVAASTTLNLYRDGAGLAWTASGTKNATFTMVYEIA